MSVKYCLVIESKRCEEGVFVLKKFSSLIYAKKNLASIKDYLYQTPTILVEENGKFRHLSSEDV